jgi:hypothetical protein
MTKPKDILLPSLEFSASLLVALLLVLLAKSPIVYGIGCLAVLAMMGHAIWQLSEKIPTDHLGSRPMKSGLTVVAIGCVLAWGAWEQFYKAGVAGTEGPASNPGIALPSIRDLHQASVNGNDDGTFTRIFAFELIASAPQNSVFVRVRKADAIGDSSNEFSVIPVTGYANNETGEVGDYYWCRLSTPHAGLISIILRTRRADSEIPISIEINK